MSRPARRGAARVSLFVVWGSWVVLNVVPALIVRPPRNYYVSVAAPEVILSLIFELSLLSMEVALLATGAVAVKYLRRSAMPMVRWLGNVLATCLIGAVSAWLILLTVSWRLYGTTQTFVDPVHVRMFLAPFGGEHSLVIAQDWRIVWMCVAVAASAAAAFAFLMSRTSFRPRLTTLAMTFCVGFFGALLARGPLATGFLRSERCDDFQAYVAHFTAPDATLVLSYLEQRDANAVPLDQTVLDPRSASTIVPAQRRSSAPNVILLLVEALRSDVFNEPTATSMYPNIAHVAGMGCRYTHVYTQSNESNYSFVSLLSGTYSLTERFRDDFAHGHERILLADVLSRLGYQTGSFMGGDDRWQNLRNALFSPRLDVYFVGETVAASEREQLIASRGRPVGSLDVRDVLWVERLRRWLRERDPSRPFFAFGAFIGSHFPYQGVHGGMAPFSDMELDETQAASLSFLGYPRELRLKMKHRYLTALMDVDELVGEIVDELAREGLMDSTVVLITGDHGELFGEHDQVNHAGELWDPAVRVPLVVSQPEWCRMATDTPLQLVDIAPSIVDAAAGTALDGFQGDSLLSSPRVRRVRPLFSTVQSVAHQDALIAWPWKVIADHRSGRVRAFDLARDPDEVNDIATTAAPQVRCLTEMVRRYGSWQLQYYADPNLRRSYLPPRYEFGRECAGILTGG